MFRIGLILICTPLSGILAGFIYAVTGILKARVIGSPSEILTGVLAFGMWGSIFAAPTTLFGLPIAAVILSPTDRRFPLKLTISGFVLGWLTVLGWYALLAPKRWPHSVRELLEQIVVISAVCVVGAICGALSGRLMAYSFKMESDELDT